MLARESRQIHFFRRRLFVFEPHACLEAAGIDIEPLGIQGERCEDFVESAVEPCAVAFLQLGNLYSAARGSLRWDCGRLVIELETSRRWLTIRLASSIILAIALLSGLTETGEIGENVRSEDDDQDQDNRNVRFPEPREWVRTDEMRWVSDAVCNAPQ